MVAHRYHSILPHVNWNVCDILLSSFSFDFKFNFKQKLNFYFICYFKCVCKVILKSINIFRANYDHEIHKNYIFKG